MTVTVGQADRRRGRRMCEHLTHPPTTHTQTDCGVALYERCKLTCYTYTRGKAKRSAQIPPALQPALQRSSRQQSLCGKQSLCSQQRAQSAVLLLLLLCRQCCFPALSSHVHVHTCAHMYSTSCGCQVTAQPPWQHHVWVLLLPHCQLCAQLIQAPACGGDGIILRLQQRPQLVQL